ncbi:hypothetical protein FKM82_008950 [Ascaphus truei]
MHRVFRMTQVSSSCLLQITITYNKLEHLKYCHYRNMGYIFVITMHIFLKILISKVFFFYFFFLRSLFLSVSQVSFCICLR